MSSILRDSDENTLDTGQTWTNLDVIKQNVEFECDIAKYKCLYCIYKICMTEKNTCEEYTGIIYIYIHTYTL